VTEVVTVEHHGRIALARCHGELDLSVRDELRGRLVALPSREVHSVVLDLSDVTFLDCAALSAVIALARECAHTDVRLLLAGVPGIGWRLMDVLQLTDHFVIASTLEQAMALAEAWVELAGPPAQPPSPFLPRPPHLAALDPDQGIS
jgi:anti-anti-sigma factor